VGIEVGNDVIGGSGAMDPELRKLCLEARRETEKLIVRLESYGGLVPERLGEARLTKDTVPVALLVERQFRDFYERSRNPARDPRRRACEWRLRGTRRRHMNDQHRQELLRSSAAYATAKLSFANAIVIAQRAGETDEEIAHVTGYTVPIRAVLRSS
jgi:hypothetical protein